MTTIAIKAVNVDADVSGIEMSVQNVDALAQLIAIIALGQADHAVKIISSLDGGAPAVHHKDLYRGARGQLSIKGADAKKREVSGYHRDGFLFECMSWIVARQSANDRTFMKDPHIQATTQGLDGLMIEMHPTDDVLLSATIFEDKCTDSPRDKFRDEVMKTFGEHHLNDRCTDLLANTVSLIKDSGLKGSNATVAAARVLDKQYRTYRASLTVGSACVTEAKRAALFKNYSDLDNIQQAQRVGAVLVLPSALRPWFQDLADRAIQAVDDFEAADV